jgi:hypothetical protein
MRSVRLGRHADQVELSNYQPQLLPRPPQVLLCGGSGVKKTRSLLSTANSLHPSN